VSPDGDTTIASPWHRSVRWNSGSTPRGEPLILELMPKIVLNIAAILNDGVRALQKLFYNSNT
jgi:hypothetical protein